MKVGIFRIYSQKGLNKAARLNHRFCEGKGRFAENRPCPSRKFQWKHDSEGGKCSPNRRQGVGRESQARGKGF